MSAEPENTRSHWVVHKFGGTSVADADRYKNVAQIVAPSAERQAVVVSAMSQVTDALIELAHLAVAQDSVYLTQLSGLHEKHVRTVTELLPGAAAEPLKKIFEADFENLKEVLRGVWHVRSCSDRTLDLIAGHGEVWSAQILTTYFNFIGRPAVWIDARKILMVEPSDTSVTVLWPESEDRMATWLNHHAEVDLAVITGFVATTVDGIATTLKRNGSDYSASIFGSLLDAKSITIWTDVDGVLSADPRRVPEAVVLEDLSYAEATELAYFGAKVVHPSTMAPAVRRQIPIWIKNSFRPAAPGTCIHAISNSAAAVKGFATVDDVALLNVEGPGMVGVPGVAQRLFGALREIGISVIMISQASSEHSICFAIPLAQAARAREAVEKAFAAEIYQGVILRVDVKQECSILAAVGDNMVHRPGLAGKFLSALGRAGVNVIAIAQGSSERNISVVVARSQVTRALRAVHSGFFLSNHTLSVGIIGTGFVGKTLLAQIHQTAQALRDELKIDVRVRGIADSKKMLLAEPTINLDTWPAQLSEAPALSLDDFVKHVHADFIPHAVLIDCTANQDIALAYADWLRDGIHVITPNKKANTLDYDYYQRLKKTARQTGRYYLYETTVGAGLPVINTLRELVRTGDRVLEIEGVFSGTLSFIFNNFSAARPFSEVVLEAKRLGYTEPDPRDDLSGMDVARKLVILAREMGLAIEMKDVVIEPLLPARLQEGQVADFLKNLKIVDESMLTQIREAETKGEVLRYVGRIDEHGRATVALRRYKSDHAFARIAETDNIVAFRTGRYARRPLIVQGPGAGPEVTAAGVFAEILRLSSYLGAPL